MTRGLLSALLLACGGSAAPSASSTDPAEGSEGAGEPAARAEPSAEPTPSVEEEPEASRSCAERSAGDCRFADGCVLERDQSCRDAANECERIQVPLDGSQMAPVFRGDPCEQANEACAWDTSTGRCAPFVAVSACPGSAEAAEELSVFCNHSRQPELRCSFAGSECACRKRPHCGGFRPSPAQSSPPAVFSCQPDFDDRGCPNRAVRPGTRCDLDPSVRCQLGCSTGYRCERGRWREYELPPRP